MSITEIVERSHEESHFVKHQTVEAVEAEEYGSNSHPLGVRPGGNALTTRENSSLFSGDFASLTDTLLLALLEWLDGPSLVALGSTCRALFAYCSYDQLWRDLATSTSIPELEWRGSWRSSLRKLPIAKLPDINCRNVFSDALHRPFVCSNLDVIKYACEIPTANRIAALSDLSLDDFNESWTDTPFILRDPIKQWRVSKQWSFEHLAKRYADVAFRAEAVDWPMKRYMDYLRNTRDESPLYLFDRSFVEKMQLDNGSDGDYEVPSCFSEDLFTVLGPHRPDHRWLIIGPERSGSTFHKDPNATSAWNAVVRGSKYWIMFPPAVLPPGVYVSEDQSEVTSPLSIAEWLLTFHEEARNTPGCMEGICQEGEVLHVPSGWWHLVVNLESAIAITQNFVPRQHLNSVVHFLDRKRAQISGFKSDVTDPFQTFMERLRDQYPELADTLRSSTTKKRKWEEVVGTETEEDNETNGCFSFGFGDDDLDAEVE